MIDRSKVADRIRDRVWEILEKVPPVRPPAPHWLNSDASPSYCWGCAIKARAEEFGLGVPLENSDRWRCGTDLEEAFYEGIDGGFEGEADHTESCETCGMTLAYILTDYGARNELNYYLEAPLIVVRDEDSYALDRACLNIFDGSPRGMIVQAAKIVGHAYRLVTK